MKKIYSLAMMGLASLVFGQISLTNIGTAYTQNFDGLTSGTSTVLTGSLAGWSIVESGSNSNTSYIADNGNANAGNTYSYGTTGSTDRALGALASGSLESRWGAQFENNTGTVINQLLISYVGEQWRFGGGRSTQDHIIFEISTNATSLNNGTWTAVTALDYLSSNIAGTAGSRDGNNSTYKTVLNGTVPGLNISAGSTFWIRFVDENITGNDDGLAIDDFSLTPQNSGSLSTADVKNSKNLFVKNTVVKNEITFGTKAQVKIYSVNGQLVKTVDVTENKSLNVADLQNGIYIVTGLVEGKNVSQKIIKN